MYFEVGTRKILADSYITRVPESAFHGGGGGLANTSRAFKPDIHAIKQVRDAIGGESSVDLLLTGHSHFDHAFDTATWAKLTGAAIMGSPTTCYQVEAEAVPRDQCTALYGGERISLSPALTMYVVRWNHSGDPAKNPEQHNAIELTAPPQPDPATGGLRAGVAEDFPNGGGNRAYLFVLDGAEGQFSWFFHDSASAVDLHVPIVVAGKDHGAPLDNLKQAMLQAKLDRVDLWIGTGSTPVAQLIVPVIRPKAHIPVHWDNFWSPFLAGVTQPYSDAALEQYLSSQDVTLIKPQQYMDKWRLDVRGTQPISNETVQRRLGFLGDSSRQK
jgi:L-ascorbate metabolism protein UlaG (beta-lactamase superfamily)